jgi:hypothetical protein
MSNAQKGVQSFWAADVSSPGFLLKSPTNRLLIKQYGAWWLHEFGVAVSPKWTGDGRGRVYGFTEDWTPAVFDLVLDRPAFTSDLFAQPGDLSDTPEPAYVTFAEHWTEDNNHQQVTEVVVNFRRWDTGCEGGNNFSVTVDALSRGSEVPLRSHTQTWSQAGNLSPATQHGIEDQVRLQFGEQGEGAGYRVTISDIRGVAIRSVAVNDRPHETNARVW